jgi:hypothetical protein
MVPMVGAYGCLWVPMGAYGAYGCLWVPMGAYGCLWVVPMGAYGAYGVSVPRKMGVYVRGIVRF